MILDWNLFYGIAIGVGASLGAFQLYRKSVDHRLDLFEQWMHQHWREIERLRQEAQKP